jgi:tRNA (guanine-N7-)-methyltransferase
VGQKKLIRFAELNNFPNVRQFPLDAKGNWADFFGNDRPIILELACGKGEYAVNLGQSFPEKNYVGVDLKGNRIWVGARKALQQKLDNVAFLRTQIELLDQYFAPGEVDEIWITFPDPQLRTSKAKKRLTHPRFLRIYQRVLKPGGMIHLKTDSPSLYEFTKQVIEMYEILLHEDRDNVHNDPSAGELLRIKTHYEALDIAGSSRVHYLRFSVPAHIPGPEKDSLLKEQLKENESAGTR